MMRGDGLIPIMALQRLHHLQAREARHLDVGQHQGGLECADLGEASSPSSQTATSCRPGVALTQSARPRRQGSSSAIRTVVALMSVE
jgi:hypothetical protein